MYVAFIEPCFGIGHNLSLICQMTSEDIKHQLIIAGASRTSLWVVGTCKIKIDLGALYEICILTTSTQRHL